jgi:hypothetical protein
MAGRLFSQSFQTDKRVEALASHHRWNLKEYLTDSVYYTAHEFLNSEVT